MHEKFWKSLEEHAMKIINFEKKKIISVTEKVLRKSARIVWKLSHLKKIELDADDEKYCKFRDHCHYTGKYRGAAHSVCI